MRLEAAAREALAAYRAIGMGQGGWNARDHAAFVELAAALDDLPPKPALPARRQSVDGKVADVTRALALLGIAYRLRRCRRLLRARRLAEVDRVSAAVGRDLARLKST